MNSNGSWLRSAAKTGFTTDVMYPVGGGGQPPGGGGGGPGPVGPPNSGGGPGGGGLATGLVGGLGGLGLGPMIGQPPSAGTLGGLGSTSGSGDSSPPGGIISGSTMNRDIRLSDH